MAQKVNSVLLCGLLLVILVFAGITVLNALRDSGKIDYYAIAATVREIDELEAAGYKFAAYLEVGRSKFFVFHIKRKSQ